MAEMKDPNTGTLIGTQTRKQTVGTFGKHVSSGKVNFFRNAGMDFIPGRREGLYIWDVDGEKRLINCHCNGGLYNLGHRHPAVMARLRQVVIDVLANLCKEKRADVIPSLLVTANRFLEESTRGGVFKPVTQKEVSGYYKEDARIWTVYLAFRRLDRWIHRLLGRPYPYVLPGRVDR